MNNIPKKLQAELEGDPYYGACARQALLGDHVCQRDPVSAPRWKCGIICPYKVRN